MTTRIGGDFNQDAVEAFRDAYAQILNSPDDDTVANESGLLTDTVANTSPWHNHLPLWKYPSGKGPDEDLKRSFDPNDFISQQDEEEEEVDDSPMTDEEVETLIDELLNSTNEEDEEIEE
jgi:hypothetical protein